MSLYFANAFALSSEIGNYLDFQINMLESFTSFSNTKGVSKPLYCHNLFLDSGAFGKYSSKITLDSYINFVHKNITQIDIYANLDVIGNPKETAQNQITMEKAGLGPLPTFHYNSDEKWLKYYLNRGHNYIALGGMVKVPKKQLVFWLDRIWNTYLIDKEGYPKVKIHGFGILFHAVLARYPWHSVDSSSMHVEARYGGVYTPWGPVRINPQVKGNHKLITQIRTLKHFEQVQRFVEEGLPTSYVFEDARANTPQGTLLRSIVSIKYLQSWVNKTIPKKFTGPKSPSVFNILET